MPVLAPPPPDIRPPEKKTSGILERIFAVKHGFHEKIKGILSENPLVRAGRWVQETGLFVKEKIEKLLPWLTKEILPKAETSVQKSPAPEPEKSAPEDLFGLAETKHKEKMNAMLSSFHDISHQLTGIKRTSEMDIRAFERIKKMKETGLLEHDQDFLSKEKCFENIQSGYLTSGKEIAQKFMDSMVHRRNMLGTHNELGLAMDVVFDQKEKKYMYYIVALYRGGESIPNTEEPPAKKIPSVSEKDFNLIGPYYEPYGSYITALDEEIKKKALHITRTVDEKRTALLDPGERNKGSFAMELKDPSGKVAHYFVSPNPPLLIRLEEGKRIKELHFQELILDFTSLPSSPPSKPDEPKKPEQLSPEDETAILNPS